MTTNRKIQSEIERTLKKVQEGMEVFEAMWDKVHSAPTQLQKEKYEADLKKEIKKLQRLREQIKTWQAAPEIKDKKAINEARKQIETKMEMFKVCEKETKTKAYSKEGLALPNKSDPAEAAKANTQEWINECIQSLNDLVDEIEVQLESTEGRKKKGGKEDGLSQTLSRHKYHIMKLEQVLRMIDNDELTPSDVDEIQGNVEDYIEANGEMPEEDEEGIYDCLDLPAIDASAAPVSADDEDEEKKIKKEEVKKPTTVKPAPPPVTVQAKIQPAVVKTVQPPVVKTIPIEPAPKKVPIAPIVAEVAKKATTMAANVKAATTVTTAAPPQPKIATKNSPAAPGGKTGKSVPNSPIQATDDSMEDDTMSQQNLPESVEAKQAPLNEWNKSSQTAAARLAQQQTQQSAPPTALASATTPTPAAPAPAQPGREGAANQQPPIAPLTQPVRGQSPTPQPSAPNAPLNALLNFQGPAPLKFEKSAATKMLESSYKNLPQPTDCEKAKPYVPPNPYRTMPFYPQAPHPIFNSPEIFSKFDADTLFFIFYYQQATYQQYLAAVELKRQSWRYHKKYLTWFQRHEKPKASTDEYEQGNYLYFDYESGWNQRVKQDFTFKYSYLEDELVVL
eukprot:PhF_6_TR27819/c0_g1_i1/m.40577/K12580/CNOT3, NOT3; CCR4-NOT transcription complex subunit 3